MKCPYCFAQVGLFAAPSHRFAPDKPCPHCAKPVRMDASIPTILIGMIVTVAVGWALVRYEAPTFWMSLWTGIAVAGFSLAAMRLRKGAE